MIIKQISVFIENKSGRLAEVTGIIAESGVNMRSIVLAEQVNSGKLRIIADDPVKAGQVLKKNGMRYELNEVIAVLVDDKAGGLAGMLEALAGGGVGIRYMYGFAGKHEKACMVLRIGEEFRDKAVQILRGAGYEGLETE